MFHLLLDERTFCHENKTAAAALNPAALNPSAFTLFAMVRLSLTDVFLVLPLDLPASHELVSSQTFKIQRITLFAFLTMFHKSVIIN